MLSMPPLPPMPQIIAIAVISGLCALGVVLTLRLVGLGEHAPVAAAVSASSSAVVASRSLWRHRARRALR